MKQRLLYFVKYYLFWLLFFVVQKPAFMLWQYRLLGDVRLADWFLVPWHGLPLDLSVAAYITAVAGLLLTISLWVKWRYTRVAIDVFTAIIMTIGLWTWLGDNGCFPSWGYHLDKTIFTYLSSPNEVLACAPWWVWVLACVGFAALMFVWWRVYRRWLPVFDSQKHLLSTFDFRLSTKITYTLLMVLLTGLLFLPMRGSVTVSTMNTGRVYYSNNRQLNMAAINPVFHIMESLSENTFDATRYQYMRAEEAIAETRRLFAPLPNDSVHPQILTTKRPNIVLIVMESFSSNAWKAMPCLRKLAQEGIFFSRAYASSYRTDRGVMAVLGAFPGCGASSVMTVPAVSQRLPQVGQELKQQGYKLKFYYGGDEDFTNMRSYLVTGGFEQRVCDRDFPVTDRLSKWGVPDHVLLPFAAQDIVHRYEEHPRKRFFSTVLTLSSHEPFDVPMHRYGHAYVNAIAYTDSCIGVFTDILRQSPMWDSTLLVLVADHGYPYPDGVLSYDTLRYRIPLIWSGGAVCAPREVATLCSQVDWVPTLLHQMDIDASRYIFAKDILNPSTPHWAYYNFNDGFALLSDTATTVIDAKVNSTVPEYPGHERLQQQARAMTQSIVEYIR